MRMEMYLVISQQLRSPLSIRSDSDEIFFSQFKLEFKKKTPEFVYVFLL